MFHGPIFPLNYRESLKILHKMSGFMERFSTSPYDFENHFVRALVATSCIITIQNGRYVNIGARCNGEKERKSNQAKC